MLDKILNLFGGIIYAILPLAVGLFIAALCWDTAPDWRGGLSGGLVALLTIYISTRIFLSVVRRGVVDFTAGTSASPHADNLIPTDSDSSRLYSAEEYGAAFSLDNNLAIGGSMQLFGDWFGKAYTEDHRISDVHFSTEDACLTIDFFRGERLEIWHPEHIFDSDTFLKILSASAVRLTWSEHSQGGDTTFFNHYTVNKRKIEKKTDFPGKQARFHSDLSKPAVVLFVKN